MNDKEIIEALIANEKPFGLMSEEMQAKAREIGRSGFDHWTGVAWQELQKDLCFENYAVYRLRPGYEDCKCKTCGDTGLVPAVTPHDITYYGDDRPCLDCQEKPEIVECEVYKENCRGNISDTFMFKTKATGDKGWYLHEAVDHPNFIGFKYEDDRMACKSKRSSLTRLYMDVASGDTYCHIGSNVFDDVEVLTPTAVLIQVTK